MTQFALFAVLLIVVTAAFLLPALWFGQRRKTSDTDRRAANLVIFRDQLAEIEKEHQAGTLSATDYAQSRDELQRRLLEEVSDAQPESATTATTSRKTAIALLVALPLAALGGYGLLGNPAALDPANTVAQKQMTPEDIQRMVERLAERMKTNPDDMQGWIMLGRSYKMLGRYADAVQAYARAEAEIAKDPELLAGYAETIAMAEGKGLAGKPKALIDQALKLDPQHGHSLFLAGAAAMESGDRKQAIAYWEALLPQVEAGSDLDRMLREGITQLKQGK